MYNKGEYVVYKRETCQVKDIISKYYKDRDYYLLSSLSDNSLMLKVPVDNNEIREVITRKEVNNIIRKIPKIDIISCDSKGLETAYKKCINSGRHEDLIAIIKTTYLRNKERIDNKKKTTDKDMYYFNLAEKYLYQEFQVALGKDYDETKEYVINNVKKLFDK